jgi:hypothetical protein
MSKQSPACQRSVLDGLGMCRGSTVGSSSGS